MGPERDDAVGGEWKPVRPVVGADDVRWLAERFGDVDLGFRVGLCVAALPFAYPGLIGAGAQTTSAGCRADAGGKLPDRHVTGDSRRDERVKGYVFHTSIQSLTELVRLLLRVAGPPRDLPQPVDVCEQLSPASCYRIARQPELH